VRRSQPGFYESLGLTKREFYSRLKGGRRVFSSPSADAPSQPVIPPQPPPGSHARGAHQLPMFPLTESPKYAKILSRKEGQAHKATCARTKAHLPCGTCYEYVRGR